MWNKLAGSLQPVFVDRRSKAWGREVDSEPYRPIPVSPTLVSERFGRFERSGARGGIDSRQQADHAADGWREQGSERVEHWSPDLIRRDTHHDQYADAGSEQSPHDTHGRTLNEELCRDVAASRANGTAQSNLRRPLHHAHQGDICDPKRADHERQAA